MNFTSKGLGKRSLGMDCGKESTSVDGDHLLLSMDQRDWVEFFETAMHPSVVGYLSRPAKMRLALTALWYLFTFMVMYTILLPVVWVSKVRRGSVASATPSDELAHSTPPGSARANRRE